MSVLTPEEDRNVLSPSYIGAHGVPHEIWEKLRREDPIHFVADWAGDPFWAVTRYDDIIEINKHPDVFRNHPRFQLKAEKNPPEEPYRTIVNMDAPEHRKYRNIVAPWFTPKAMVDFQSTIDEMSDKVIQRAAPLAGQTVNVVSEISARMPIWVVSYLLGLSEEHWETVFNWTNELVAYEDPDYNRGRDPRETAEEAFVKITTLCMKLHEARLADPKDDITTALGKARIDGKPIPEMELASNYMLLFGAGNETVRNTTSGIFKLLVDEPGLLQRLKDDPDLIPNFIDEALRLISPALQMVRTPAEDVEVGGKQIKAGQPMVLLFGSANRDEAVFENPHECIPDRENAKRHLAFGFGAHKCLGFRLAKLQLETLFPKVIRVLDEIELVEEPVFMASCHNGGLKKLMVRYSMDLQKL